MNILKDYLWIRRGEIAGTDTTSANKYDIDATYKNKYFTIANYYFVVLAKLGHQLDLWRAHHCQQVSLNLDVYVSRLWSC